MEVFDSVDEFIAWIDLILSRLNGSETYATSVWNEAWQQAAFNGTHFGLQSESDHLAHLRSYLLSPDSREAELIRNQLRDRLAAIRVALTGHVGSGDLAAQWRRLADRFRRNANNDCGESGVEATAAIAGTLLPSTRQHGLPLNYLEPSAAELQQHARQPDVIAHLWSTCWTGFVIALSVGNPGFPIPNPLGFTSEHRGGPNDISVGSTDKADWRIRAENFAAVCDALADEVAELRANRSAETATNGQGGEPGDDLPSTASLALEELLGDEAKPILKAARSDKSADDRMRAICGIDRRLLHWKARQWANLLSLKKSITPDAIRQTQFWKVDRKRAIEAERELREDIDE